MKACEYCGRENEDSARFCGGCGTALGQEAQDLSPRAPHPPSRAPEIPPLPTAPSKASAYRRIILLGSILLVVAGFAWPLIDFKTSRHLLGIDCLPWAWFLIVLGLVGYYFTQPNTSQIAATAPGQGACWKCPECGARHQGRFPRCPSCGVAMCNEIEFFSAMAGAIQKGSFEPVRSEDARCLKEFYPNVEERARLHHTFAHWFLPQYIHRNPRAFFWYLYRHDMDGIDMDPSLFLHARWCLMERELGLVPYGTPTAIMIRRVTDLEIWLATVAGHPGIFIQMPPPEAPLAAFFIGAVLLASPEKPGEWPEDVQARVFTLEAAVSDTEHQDKQGVFCERQKGGQHGNFGISLPATREGFLKGVTYALEHPVAPQCGYRPPTSSSPGQILLTVSPPPTPPPG